MTNHVVRLYALAASLLVLFLTWAAIASHPWSSGSRSASAGPPRGRDSGPANSICAKRRSWYAASSPAGGTNTAWRSLPGSARSQPRNAVNSRPPPRSRPPRRRRSRWSPCRRSRSRGRRDAAPELPRDGHEGRAVPRAEPGPRRARPLDGAEREFERLEALLSRFRPDSELSQLNARGPARGRRGPARGRRARARGAGADGRPLRPDGARRARAAGYDRTFDEVAPDGHAPAAPPARCGGGVTVDRARPIELEPGVRLDLGGIGKGYAADRARGHPRRGRPRASSTRAATSPLSAVPTRSAGGSASRPPPARSRSRSATARVATSGPRPPPLAPRRRRAAPPDRPGDRPSRRGDLLRVTVVARHRGRGRGAGQGALPRRRAGGHRRGRGTGVACVLVTDDGRTVVAGGLA